MEFGIEGITVEASTKPEAIVEAFAEHFSDYYSTYASPCPTFDSRVRHYKQRFQEALATSVPTSVPTNDASVPTNVPTGGNNSRLLEKVNEMLNDSKVFSNLAVINLLRDVMTTTLVDQFLIPATCPFTARVLFNGLWETILISFCAKQTDCEGNIYFGKPGQHDNVVSNILHVCYVRFFLNLSLDSCYLSR